jgi:hypothetical protein
VASSCKWWWSWLSCMCWSLTHLSVEISMLVRIPNVRMKFGKQQEKMRGSWLRSQTPWIVLDERHRKREGKSKIEGMLPEPELPLGDVLDCWPYECFGWLSLAAQAP